MFPSDSIACSVIAGFFPLFDGSADCSLEFVASMVIGCFVAFVCRIKGLSRLKALVGGVAAYNTTLAIAWAMTADINQIGWLFVIFIFVIPRALLASMFGLSAWEIYRITKISLNKGGGNA